MVWKFNKFDDNNPLINYLVFNALIRFIYDNQWTMHLMAI